MHRFSNSIRLFIPLLFLAVLSPFAANPIAARAGIGIYVSFGPPAIPVYAQPANVNPNYVWQPGYWAYDGGYYWVPGTWVPAPSPGLYWTPGYWGWNNGYYGWNQGYWAPQVGFYGGVNYGYGYSGNGYYGGRWHGNHFRYNTAFSNVNRHAIQNVYSSRAGYINNSSRVSYNGGRGGLSTRASQSQLALARGRHVAPTSVQTQHQTVAAQNRANFSTVNHGRPATAAVARPYSSAYRPAGAVATAHTATAHAATAHTATAHTATAHAAAPQRAAAAPQRAA
ncbi:MAG: YXWGXW repeat-containing protein, partial [Candidatus Velthaea sp.]